MIKVINVDKHGVGKKLGIRAGDTITKIGGQPAVDLLDYFFFDEEDDFEIEYIDAKGRTVTKRVRKKYEQSLGLELEGITTARCKNKCKFCFVDQLPKGMRDTLYVKDDDYRMSFLCGNYVTLTNVTETDVDRICRMKLSPLYISVHAFDPEVRRSLMKNPATLKLNGYLQRFAENGIIMHTQVVLCEGINDGEVLKDTLEGLYSLYPAVRTVAIVPVGLTAHRQGLEELKPLSQECLDATIDMVEAFNKDKGFCWCSDEFYLKAGRPLPDYEYYDEFFQIENGVGLIAEFNKTLDLALENTEEKTFDGQRVVLITGVSFEPVLLQAAERIKKKLKNVIIDVQAVKNRYFGENITVAGLLTGQDILAQTPRGADLYVIPKNTLREFEEVFLDGFTLEAVRGSLGRVEIADSFAENLVDLILGIC